MAFNSSFIALIHFSFTDASLKLAGSTTNKACVLAYISFRDLNFIRIDLSEELFEVGCVDELLDNLCGLFVGVDC